MDDNVIVASKIFSCLAADKTQAITGPNGVAALSLGIDHGHIVLEFDDGSVYDIRVTKRS